MRCDKTSVARIQLGTNGKRKHHDRGRCIDPRSLYAYVRSVRTRTRTTSTTCIRHQHPILRLRERQPWSGERTTGSTRTDEWIVNKYIDTPVLKHKDLPISYTVEVLHHAFDTLSAAGASETGFHVTSASFLIALRGRIVSSESR